MRNRLLLNLGVIGQLFGVFIHRELNKVCLWIDVDILFRVSGTCSGWLWISLSDCLPWLLRV